MSDNNVPFQTLINPLTQNYNEFSKHFKEFPAFGEVPFYVGISTHMSGHMVLGHPIIGRSDHQKQDGVYLSEVGDLCSKVIQEILNHNQIDFNYIYRANVNFVLPQYVGDEQVLCDPHTDHQFDHKVLIVYLSCSSDSGNTIIYNEQDQYDSSKPEAFTPNVEIVPRPDKAITFDGSFYHAIGKQVSPRVALVVTYG